MQHSQLPECQTRSSTRYGCAGKRTLVELPARTTPLVITTPFTTPVTTIHHPGLAHRGFIRHAPKNRCCRAGSKSTGLFAWIAQTRGFDHCRFADVQPGINRQRQQIEIARGDVLAALARRYFETSCRQLSKEPGMNKVYLLQVRLRGALRNPGAMLHVDSAVHITVDPKADRQIGLQ